MTNCSKKAGAGQRTDEGGGNRRCRYGRLRRVSLCNAGGSQRNRCEWDGLKEVAMSEKMATQIKALSGEECAAE